MDEIKFRSKGDRRRHAVGTDPRRDRRRQEAEARADERGHRSAEDQIARLDAGGHRALRERARLKRTGEK